MRDHSAVVLFLALLLPACGGGSPSGPSKSDALNVLTGRTISGVDNAALSGLSVSVDARSTTTDADGYFKLDVDGPSTYPITVSGTTIVERVTAITGPTGEAAVVSVMPSSFDLAAFDEMFRGGVRLRRWTTKPALVVLGTVMNYVSGNTQEYTATSQTLSNDDVTLMVAHLTEGLSLLTSGAFTAFASVEIERPSAGQRVNVQRHGKIVVGRYTGISARGSTIGWGQWVENSDGSIAGGASFLDRDFDRDDERRRLLRIHELGHALGYGHVTVRPSVMNPAIGSWLTDFDTAATRIAFQRPPGNVAPDTDPRSGGVSASTSDHAGRWADPIYCH